MGGPQRIPAPRGAAPPRALECRDSFVREERAVRPDAHRRATPRRVARDVGQVVAQQRLPAREDQERRRGHGDELVDRKSTRLNSSHGYISYAVFCLKKKKKKKRKTTRKNEYAVRTHDAN